MGELSERVKLSLLVHGDGIPDNFKKNSLFFYEKYLKSDKEVKNIPVNDLKPGGFYFFHYKDDSNWMRWAPVYLSGFKKFNNQIILLCVNFNFLPLEIRVLIFDQYINESNIEKDTLLNAKYEMVYSDLKKVGFEYSLMEFNAIQLVAVHKISMSLLPRFLYSQHPKNVYDPKKLLSIWEAKISTRDERNKEMMLSVVSEWYDVNKEISDKYSELKDHIKRLRTSMNKYGKS